MIPSPLNFPFIGQEQPEISQFCSAKGFLSIPRKMWHLVELWRGVSRADALKTLGNMVTGDWKSQWAAGGKKLRQFRNTTKREEILKSPEQRDFPVSMSSILTWNSNPSPPLHHFLRETGKFETNSCCRERKLLVNVQILQCFWGVLNSLDCSFSIPSSPPLFLPHLDPKSWVRTSSTQNWRVSHPSSTSKCGCALVIYI